MPVLLTALTLGTEWPATHLPVMVATMTAGAAFFASAPDAEAIRRKRRRYRRPRLPRPRNVTRAHASVSTAAGLNRLRKWQKQAERDRHQQEMREIERATAIEELRRLQLANYEKEQNLVFQLPAGRWTVVRHSGEPYFYNKAANLYYYCYYIDGQPVYVEPEIGPDGKPKRIPEPPDVL